MNTSGVVAGSAGAFVGVPDEGFAVGEELSGIAVQGHSDSAG